MSKSNACENSLLLLIYNATAWANLADNASSSPATNITWHLHVADPGEAGSSATSECSYTSYAAQNVARSGAGHVVSGNSCSPAATIPFPACTSGTQTATHFSTTLQGSTVILHSGTITPNLSISSGVTPQLTTATAIVED